MEDRHMIVDGFGGIPEDGYFAIYDGHGGTDAVMLINELLHDIFLDYLLKTPEDVEKAFVDSFKAMDDLIKDVQKYSAGSTIVICYLRGNENGKKVLYTANVGDSRAVLQGEGRLSVDHKPKDVEETKRVKELGGWVSNGRVNGIIAVSRALGDHDLKPYISCKPFVSRKELNDSHQMLILACDGLWDVCSDDEAIEKALVHVENPSHASNVLVNYALKKNSTDNISVMCVQL